MERVAGWYKRRVQAWTIGIAVCLTVALNVDSVLIARRLGAPFWFDVLNRFMSIRSSGKAPEEAPKSPKQIPIPAVPGRPEGSPAPAESPAKA